MTGNNHDEKRARARQEDQAEPRRHFLLRAHRDWRVWVVVILMIALMLVYVLTDNLSLRPGQPPTQPMPEAIGP